MEKEILNNRKKVMLMPRFFGKLSGEYHLSDKKGDSFFYMLGI